MGIALDIKNLGFFKIYDTYLIVEMNEGVTITPDSNDALEEIADIYYPTKNFVYITHRKNSYAVDPAVYTRTSKIKNLVGFAVVSTKRIALSNAEIEKLFLSKPFEVFHKIEDAVKWANKICTNENHSFENKKKQIK